MNSTQSSAGTRPLTLRDRVVVWKELLEQCGRKPTRKYVHGLRVVTLRLQAELENELCELPHASHSAQAMLRFGKQADKLRQALGPVRELDVWIGKLQKLRSGLSQSTGYVPRSTEECVRQMERMEDRLKKKRRAAGQKLVAQIAKRGANLRDAGDAIHDLVGDQGHVADLEAFKGILNQFVAVIAGFASFDEENLHDFRKRIKKIRYLAEIHQVVDPACDRIAAQLKKLQAAIGEWHDWQALASTARQGRHARETELGELLDSLTVESGEAAVAACHGAKARILAIRDSSFPASSKAPVSSDQRPPAPLRKLA